MMFLKSVIKKGRGKYNRNNSYGDGSSYWAKDDVHEVRRLLKTHLGSKGPKINAVFVGLNGARKKGKSFKCASKRDYASGEGSLKILGWVEKNKDSAYGDGVKWKYAKNAEGDEDDTTIDMTDALVQEDEGYCPTERKKRVVQVPYNKVSGKIPLNIKFVSYKLA